MAIASQVCRKSPYGDSIHIIDEDELTSILSKVKTSTIFALVYSRHSPCFFLYLFRYNLRLASTRIGHFVS